MKSLRPAPPGKKPPPVAQRRRILLVDDHPITRQGLAALIRPEPDLEICGEAESAADALSAVDRCKPHLAIIDLSLPGRGGLDLIKDLVAMHPGLPTLVLSMHDEALYAERALRAGARGYLMKAAGGPEVVVEAIRHVLQGHIWVSPAVSARILENVATRPRPTAQAVPADSPVSRLTDRELEVFELIGQGTGTRAIAARLRVSVKTIEAHRANLKSKLGVKDAPGLVREAVRWVESRGA
jgi:DNA-binding NarL/FixJ family response regulator